MITRNNYEEFFLLYVDNELSAAERLAVERFVNEHPDLKEEWELLLQCRINPDEEPAFPGKEQLLKQWSPVADVIDTTNYDTWFLSYIDGELDEPSRQAVADFVRRHPEKSIELQRLQQTVNIPDPAIVFPDKESLYRRGDRKKIAWLPFARIAAAALILGALALLIFHPFRPDKPLAAGAREKQRPLTPENKSSALPETTAPLAHTDNSSGAHNTPASPSYIKDSAASSLASASDPAKTHTSSGEKTTPERPAVKKLMADVTPVHADSLYLSNEQKTLMKPTPVTDPIAKVDPVTRPAVMDPKTIDRPGKMPETMAVTGELIETNKNTSFATQALLAGAGTGSEDGSMEETASPKKNKLRGLFRKVSRALEKPTAREDDDNKKVLIGGFQFALK